MGNRYFLLACFVFLATLSIWIRPNLFGVDSYATLTAVRFDWYDNLGHQPLANMVWGLLPDFLLVFKFIMLLSTILCIVAIFKLVTYFYDERLAWISVFLLVSLSPIVLFGFGEFENEILAYPFIVWGVYWFLTKRYSKALISFGVSLGFWLWLGYFTFFNFGVSDWAIEQNMFAGLLNLWLLLPFIFLVPLLKGKLRWFGLISVCFLLWNFKLVVFALPFIVLAITEGLLLLKEHQTLRKSLYILAFFSLIGFNIAFFIQQPTQNDVIFVKETIQLSKDTNLPVFNDWSYGYWLWAEGYKTNNNPGHEEIFDFNKNGIYLTEKDTNCLLINEKKEFARKETKIWKCD
jgi:hypothetical protein